MLEADPRFRHPSLRPHDKQRIFESHISRLSSKRSNALYSLFAAHAPALDTPFDEVYPNIIEDATVKRLGLGPDTLEQRFDAWLRSREAEARQEFDGMLGENSFVEFWGRMRKKTLDEAALGVKSQDELDEGEGMHDGGDADITALARQIDLDEIKAVLRRDKRYRQFDHKPEVREGWLRDYLENLEAQSGSETIHAIHPPRR
jgi:transcription elongation regulator 1